LPLNPPTFSLDGKSRQKDQDKTMLPPALKKSENSNHVNIQVQESVPLTNPVEVSIHNALGVLVWQGALPLQPTLSVNLSTLNPGLYILTLRVNSRQMSKRILKLPF